KCQADALPSSFTGRALSMGASCAFARPAVAIAFGRRVSSHGEHRAQGIYPIRDTRHGEASWAIGTKHRCDGVADLRSARAISVAVTRDRLCACLAAWLPQMRMVYAGRIDQMMERFQVAA